LKKNINIFCCDIGHPSSLGRERAAVEGRRWGGGSGRGPRPVGDGPTSGPGAGSPGQRGCAQAEGREPGDKLAAKLSLAKKTWLGGRRKKPWDFASKM